MFGKEGSLMCPPGVLLEKSLQMTNRILSIHKDLECLHLYVNKLFYNFKMLLHVHCTVYSVQYSIIYVKNYSMGSKMSESLYLYTKKEIRKYKNKKCTNN